MQCAAFISVAPGDVRHALEGVLSEPALVRILARSEELGADPRQHFKLGVGCSRTACRHLKASRGVVPVQFVEYRRRILRDFYVGVVLRHRERLHLQNDDVRVIEAVVFLFEQGVRTLLCLVLQYVRDKLIRISLWLADASRHRCGKEAVGKAIVPVRVVEVSEECADASGLYHAVCHSEGNEHRCQYDGDAPLVIDVLPLLATDKDKDYSRDQQACHDDGKRDLRHRIVCRCYREAVRHVLQIVERERCHP